MILSNLYQELEFNESRPMIKVLLETDFTKEIRIAMKKGTIMKEHKTHFPIVVNVVDGDVSFGVNGEVLELSYGDMIALEPNVPHDLRANKDSVVRLTLNKGDSVERVKKVID